MKEITYDEYNEAIVTAYKYLLNKYGGYMDADIVQRDNAEVNLLTALAHPCLYLEDKLN